MAKNAKQKARQKALRNARQDGKVSGKEAKSLRDLGIQQKQIEKTKGGTVTIGRNAKPKPAAPPKSNIYKDAAETATKGIDNINDPRGQERALAAAKEDGIIKAGEAKNLLDLGIKRSQLRQSAIPDGVRINKGAQDYYAQNQTVGIYKKETPAKTNNKSGNDSGGSVWDGLFDKKTLRGLQEQVGNGINRYPEPDDDHEGINPGRAPGDIDYSGYNVGAWKKAAKELNINNVDTPGDVSRLFAFVNNYESNFNNSNGGNSSGNNNNNSTGADRDSGKFEDIKGALVEDANTSFDRADELDNKDVNTSSPYQGIIDGLTLDLANNGLGNGDRNNGNGNNNGNNNGNGATPSANPYQDIIDGLIASNTGLTDYTQQLIDDNAIAQSGFEEALTSQAVESANALAGLNDLFTTSFTGINEQMAQQQADFNTAQAFTQQQLSSANAAFLAEQQRSANLQNAYVPGVNPNALSIGYGDNRNNRKRQAADNSLSDLTIMSGLGTQGNPLAGLQLA